MVGNGQSARLQWLGMDSNLSLDHLSKSYGTGGGIDSVTFTAKAGQIFGLLGPNGAGKTTTIRTIATMLAPSSGTASVVGYDIRHQATEVRRHIGVLTTDIGIYERFSGRENLDYFAKLYQLDSVSRQHRISQLIDLLDMSAFIDKKAGTYSTGMKQKLAIARSIIHDPVVMMLDEPTTGLDVLAAQTVLDFMQHSKQQGKCVIFSTHHMVDADNLCDQVAIMHQGKVVANDTPDNIKRQTKSSNLADAFLDIIGARPANATGSKRL